MTTFSSTPPVEPGFYEVSAFCVETWGEGTCLFDPYWYGDDMKVLSKASFIGAVDPALTPVMSSGSYIKMTGLWDGEVFLVRTATVSTPWDRKAPASGYVSQVEAGEICKGIPDRLKEKISSYRTIYKSSEPDCEQVFLHVESYEQSVELEKWVEKKNGVLLTSVFTPL